MKLVVLDYSVGSVDIYQDWQPTEPIDENAEIKKLGYDIDEVSWIYGEQLEFKVINNQ